MTRHAFFLIVSAALTAACRGTSSTGTDTTSTTMTDSAGGGGSAGSGGTAGGGGIGGGTSGGGTGGTGAAAGSGGTGGSSACMLDPAAAYAGGDYDKNAAAVLSLRSQFTALTAAMSAAEADIMVKPTLAELTGLYEAGAPSVRSITSAYYDGKVLGWLADFEEAAGNTWTPASPPAGPGGLFGKYIFSANGTDLRQNVEKGLFEAAFYNHALGLRKAGIDAASLDALLASFGAHPSFPGDSAAMMNPDKLGAQYAERRSPKDPNDASEPLDPAAPGPYFRIKGHFITAQQAIKAGAACDKEREGALAGIFSEWERVMFATVIFYFNDAALKLTKEPATTDDLASGLHGYGEAVGFIHGFRGLPADGRVITDAQIDDLLATINAPHDKPAGSYLFVTDGATEVPKLITAIDKIAAIYGFSAKDIEGFKTAY